MIELPPCTGITLENLKTRAQRLNLWEIFYDLFDETDVELDRWVIPAIISYIFDLKFFSRRLYTPQCILHDGYAIFRQLQRDANILTFTKDEFRTLWGESKPRSLVFTPVEESRRQVSKFQWEVTCRAQNVSCYPEQLRQKIQELENSIV